MLHAPYSLLYTLLVSLNRHFCNVYYVPLTRLIWFVCSPLSCTVTFPEQKQEVNAVCQADAVSWPRAGHMVLSRDKAERQRHGAERPRWTREEQPSFCCFYSPSLSVKVGLMICEWVGVGMLKCVSQKICFTSPLTPLLPKLKPNCCFASMS